MVKPEYSMTIFFFCCAVIVLIEHQHRLTIKKDLSNFKALLICFKNNDNNNFELPIVNYLMNHLMESKVPHSYRIIEMYNGSRNINVEKIEI